MLVECQFKWIPTLLASAVRDPVIRANKAFNRIPRPGHGASIGRGTLHAAAIS